MRTVSLMFLTLAAGSIALAATNREATYVVGNLDGVSAGATGYVRVDSDHLTFRAGKVTIETPFAKITGAELGPKLTHSSDNPKYKFWAHLGSKTIYQNITVNFKNGSGNGQSMTLELTEAAALEIHNTLDIRTGMKARRQQQEEWWGDEYWKTLRNEKSWNTQTAAIGNQ